jgi:alkylation response protein AidB-like acyl-CoA dehydrogenase
MEEYWNHAERLGGPTRWTALRGQLRRADRALTRADVRRNPLAARKAADRALALADKAFDLFDEHGYVDDWHYAQNLKLDAEYMLRRAV